jgi:hypothetical protein
MVGFQWRLVQTVEASAMDDWCSCTSWENGEIQFTADGAMIFAGMSFPSSAALDNLQIAGASISKQPGENEVVTMQTEQGSVWCKREGDRWLVKTDIPELYASMRQQSGAPPAPPAPRNSVPQVEAGGPYPDAPYPVPGGQQTRMSRWRIIATVAVIALVVVVTLFILREPLKQWAEARTVQEQKDLVQAQADVLREEEQAEYRVLETAIVQAHAEATERLERLSDASRNLEADFKKIVGLSLERVVGSPADTPGEVDFLVVTDESFLAAWNKILNAHVGPSQLNAHRKILTDIRQRIDEKQLTEGDRTALKDFRYAIEEEQEQLEAQADNLRLVRTALVRHRLEGRSP